MYSNKQFFSTCLPCMYVCINFMCKVNVFYIQNALNIIIPACLSTLSPTHALNTGTTVFIVVWSWRKPVGFPNSQKIYMLQHHRKMGTVHYFSLSFAHGLVWSNIFTVPDKQQTQHNCEHKHRTTINIKHY